MQKSSQIALLFAVFAMIMATGTHAQETVGSSGPASIGIESYYREAPLSKSDRKYADIDGKRMKRWVEELGAFSRKSRDAGVPVWGRIAGDPQDAETHKWAADLFRSFGITDVHVQEIDLPPQWRATSWEVVAHGSGTISRPESVFPAILSKGTPPEGLDLEAVWVGLGTEADFAGRDVKGKLAVIYSWPSSYPHGHSALWLGAMKRAVDRGAAAILINRAVPGNAKVIHLSAEVPTMYIGTDDAAALRDLIAKGPVTVRFKLSTEMVEGLKDANVWATLPGTGDEAIYLKAHHDGFFEGALDNATGVATLMELARHFAGVPQSQRRRTLHFIYLAAHHGQADHLWLEDKVKPVTDPLLVINLEHTALVSFLTFGNRLKTTTALEPLRWTVNGNTKLAMAFADSFSSFGVNLYDEMEGKSEAPAPGETFPWYSRPMSIAPSINLIASPQWVYHSDNDVAEFVPARGLASVARGFAKLIDKVDEMSREDIRWEDAPAAAEQ